MQPFHHVSILACHSKECEELHFLLLKNYYNEISQLQGISRQSQTNIILRIFNLENYV